jgi:hypothetical protein
MSGAIPLLPNTTSWRGAQLKKSTKTTLPLPLFVNLSICNLTVLILMRAMYFKIKKRVELLNHYFKLYFRVSETVANLCTRNLR